MNSQLLSDVISTSNFVTAYRAYDVCHDINNVVKIRSINNSNYDLNIPDFRNVYYYEDIINGQKIPFIYGDNNSFINFPNIINNSSFTICSITKYIGTNKNLQNSILTYSNSSSSISIGQYNRWSGIVYNNDKNYQISDNNNNNNWIVTCLSYDATDGSTVLIGSKKYPEGNLFNNINNLSFIREGKLSINNNTDINLNSQWALSHLFVFNTALSSTALNKIYSSMINYLSKPAINDLILYRSVYPRNLPSCITENFNANTSDTSNTNNANISNFLNISVPIWAGYFAGDYNASLNVLPEMTGNKSRDLTSDKLINVLYDATNKFIYGYKNSSVIFPENSLNSKFTICTITKYLSTDPNSNNMIIQSTRNNNTNYFYHGHFNNRKGVIMYDNFELSKGFPSTDPINSWVITCAKNNNSLNNPTNNVLINDNYEGLYLENNYNSISNTLSINYNRNNNTSFNSDWGLSYILIWNTHLSDVDLKIVSTALKKYLNDGSRISFGNSASSSTSPTSSASSSTSPTSSASSRTSSTLPSNYFICPGLNLSDIQKKMLLL